MASTIRLHHAAAMPMPPNGKSILQTADPYHTPGYYGYVPQYKYRIGNTYGKTTHKLFVDDTVPSSGSLVLTDIYKVYRISTCGCCVSCTMGSVGMKTNCERWDAGGIERESSAKSQIENNFEGYSACLRSYILPHPHL